MRVDIKIVDINVLPLCIIVFIVKVKLFFVAWVEVEEGELESILPSFHFSGFPIFVVKIEGLYHMKKMCVLCNNLA